MGFSGDAGRMRASVSKCQSLLMTSGATTASIHRKARVVEQAPAKLNLVGRDGIGLRHRRRLETRRQPPVEIDRHTEQVIVLTANSRAGCHEYSDAGNRIAAPFIRTNQREWSQRNRVFCSIG